MKQCWYRKSNDPGDRCVEYSSVDYDSDLEDELLDEDVFCDSHLDEVESLKDNCERAEEDRETAEEALVAAENKLHEVEEGPLKRTVNTAQDRVDSRQKDLNRDSEIFDSLKDDPDDPVRDLALENLQGARDGLEEAEEDLENANKDLEEVVEAAEEAVKKAREELSAKEEAKGKREAELDKFRMYNGN